MKEWIKDLYWGLQPVRLLERLIGTKARELDWKYKDFHKGNDWCGSEHKHRDLLCNIIASYKPESVLELGCNEGQNLLRLKNMIPKLEAVGIDINEKAIRNGMKIVEDNNLVKVSLLHGNINNMIINLSSDSYDVVFTDATLIYIGYKDIYEILHDLNRITKKAIIFCEWNDENTTIAGKYYRGAWIHNYQKYAEMNGFEYKLTRITSDIWNDKIWSKYGVIIEIPKI